MLRNIFLVSLLIYAVSAAHWEIREVDSAEDELEETPISSAKDGNTVKQKFPGMCAICKYVMKHVKERISTDSTPDEIKDLLFNLCNNAWLLKGQCEKFVKNHVHTLVDELMTNDGPNTICTKVLVCKFGPPTKESIFVHDRAVNENNKM